MNLALAVAGALSLLASVAAAQTAPPGQESLLRQMLGTDGGLLAGCKFDGAGVTGDGVDAFFVCGATGTPAKIRLTPTGRGGPAAHRTVKFDLVPEADVPSALVDTIEARIRSFESEWLWNVDGLPANHRLARAARRAEPPWPRGAAPTLVAVGCSWLAALSLLAWSTRRRPEPAPPVADAPDHRFTLLVAAVFLVSLGVSVDRFRFVYDDYRFLYRAIEAPWMWDEGMRFFTVSCVYRFAQLVAPGETWPFCVVNVAALLAAIAFWVLALRGAGLGVDEALLAGLLFGMAPGGADLLRRASGVENLAATALIFATLFVVQRTVRQDHIPRSRGDTALTVMLVLTLAATGTFVKFPYMVLLPPAVWMWARFVTRPSPAPVRSVLFAVAVGAASGIPWALSRGAGVSGVPTIPSELRLGFLGMNLWVAAATMAPWLSALGGTCAFLVAWRLIRVARTARRAPSRFPAALGSEATHLARATFATFVQPLGRLPLGLLMATLALLLLAPCIFNFDYFARYYVWPPAAPLAVLAARWMVKAADVRRAPLAVQLIAVALVLPRWDLRPLDLHDPTERARTFLADVAALATTGPTPDRIVLVPACDSPDEDAMAAEDLRTLYGLVGAHYGIRWATGLGPIDAAIIDPSTDASIPPEGELRLFYCPQRSLRLAPPPPASS